MDASEGSHGLETAAGVPAFEFAPLDEVSYSVKFAFFLKGVPPPTAG